MAEKRLQQWDQDLQEKQTHLEQWEQRLRKRERELNIGNAHELDLDKDSPTERNVKPFTARTTFLFYLQSGRFLRSFVFGGLDGITTTMVLVCSVNGLGTHHFEHQAEAGKEKHHAAMAGAGAILALGTANAIADAFSMGMGELLSSLADGDTEGSNLDSKVDAIRNALVMFVSFIFFGFMPLVAYSASFAFLPGVGGAIASTPGQATQQAIETLMTTRLHAAWFFCIAGLFSLGFLKGYVTTSKEERNLPGLSKHGVVMVLTGGIASALSYFISMYLHKDAPEI